MAFFNATHVEAYTRLLDWTEGAFIALFFAINRKPNEGETPVVWMINPIIYNLVMTKRFDLPLSWNDRTNIYNLKSKRLEYFKSSLYDKKGELKNTYEKTHKWLKCPGNIKAAFENGNCKYEEENPVALKPQYIHPRVVAQKGCFTVHGSKKESLLKIIENVKVQNEDYKEIFKFFSFDRKLDLFNCHNGSLFQDIYLKKYKINADEDVRLTILDDLKRLGITYYNLFPELTGLACELNMIFLDNH